MIYSVNINIIKLSKFQKIPLMSHVNYSHFRFNYLYVRSKYRCDWLAGYQKGLQLQILCLLVCYWFLTSFHRSIIFWVNLLVLSLFWIRVPPPLSMQSILKCGDNVSHGSWVLQPGRASKQECFSIIFFSMCNYFFCYI